MTSKFSVSPSPRPIGCPRCRPFTRCRARSRLVLERPSSARALSGGFILPRLASSSELLRSPSRSLLSERNSTCYQFSALFAASPKASTPHEKSQSRFVPPPGFLNLSTAFSAIWLAGLFHPATTYRVRPVQGLLPSRSSSLSSREPCPLVVQQTIAHQPKPASTLVCLDFEAFLRTKKRFCGLGLTAPQLAPLIRLLSPPGSSPFHPVLRFPKTIRS